MEDLSKDVMWDVLSRLDFKTVSCCQCVCKRWRDLVLDPYFISNLLCSNNKNPWLMIHDATGHPWWRLKLIEMQEKVVEVEKEQLVDVVTIHDVSLLRRWILSESPGFDSLIAIGPSTNGLICGWDVFGNTYIVNLVAKQYLTLPDPQPISISSLGYGFGSLNDVSYKVIRIFKTCLPHEYIKIVVFTLGTDRWRVVQPNGHVNKIRDDMGDGLFFNGRVHWINAGGHQVFVFELANETFNLFPSPPFEGEEKEQDYRGILGVLKGCLSQGCYYSFEVFTVWVMKQYGNQDSWYKAFTIKETIISRKLSCPLCFLDGLNGGTLISDAGDKLVAYCLRTNTLRTINLTSSPSNTCAPARPVRTVNIVSASTYRPTFLNLQNFATPNALVYTL